VVTRWVQAEGAVLNLGGVVLEMYDVAVGWQEEGTSFYQSFMSSQRSIWLAKAIWMLDPSCRPVHSFAGPALGKTHESSGNYGSQLAPREPTLLEHLARFPLPPALPKGSTQGTRRLRRTDNISDLRNLQEAQSDSRSLAAVASATSGHFHSCRVELLS
jgi:hypothetical protein